MVTVLNLPILKFMELQALLRLIFKLMTIHVIFSLQIAKSPLWPFQEFSTTTMIKLQH